MRHDTKSDVRAGWAAAERALAEGAVAILGTTQSAVIMAATGVAERAGVPHVVTGSTPSSCRCCRWCRACSVRPGSRRVRSRVPTANLPWTGLLRGRAAADGSAVWGGLRRRADRPWGGGVGEGCGTVENGRGTGRQLRRIRIGCGTVRCGAEGDRWKLVTAHPFGGCDGRRVHAGGLGMGCLGVCRPAPPQSGRAAAW